MSQGVYDRFVDETTEGGLVIYDSQLVKPGDLRRPRRPIGATDVAVREMENRQVANMVMLGALTTLAGVVSKASMESAVSDHVPQRFRQINLQALKRGFRLGETSR
jgi:2-oxoglutarate ferredoxin oxidoreductase subunit gamma